MKLLLSIFLVGFGMLAACRTALATAFAAVGTPSGYVLGADSRVVNQDDVVQSPTCKIGISGNTALIFTGPTAGPSFNLRSIGIPILGRGDMDVSAKEAELYRRVSKIPEYRNTVRDLKETGAGWAFIQFDGILAREFRPAPAGLAMQRKIQESSPRVFMMGTADNASKVLLPHKDEVQTMRTAVGLVERALNSSAKEQPKYVGPPYSLVFISRSGIKWIERGACK